MVREVLCVDGLVVDGVVGRGDARRRIDAVVAGPFLIEGQDVVPVVAEGVQARVAAASVPRVVDLVAIPSHPFLETVVHAEGALEGQGAGELDVGKGRQGGAVLLAVIVVIAQPDVRTPQGVLFIILGAVTDQVGLGTEHLTEHVGRPRGVLRAAGFGTLGHRVASLGQRTLDSDFQAVADLLVQVDTEVSLGNAGILHDTLVVEEAGCDIVVGFLGLSADRDTVVRTDGRTHRVVLPVDGLQEVRILDRVSDGLGVFQELVEVEQGDFLVGPVDFGRAVEGYARFLGGAAFRRDQHDAVRTHRSVDGRG